MVWVCTGSFRGVRDQPVTDHEGSIPAGVRHYSARIRRGCARSVFFFFWGGGPHPT